MKPLFSKFCVLAVGWTLVATASTAFAKLPVPSDEAKAKVAEAAAKAAHAGKVDAYLLCKSQDKVAAKVNKTKAKSATPCVDPGKFVYPAPTPVPTATVATPTKK